METEADVSRSKRAGETPALRAPTPQEARYLSDGSMAGGGPPVCWPSPAQMPHVFDIVFRPLVP